MILFFDTSALFKLYHKEEGTEELMTFFKSNYIDAIYLAEITAIEFCSAVWKKCRKREINEEIALTIIEKFNKDSTNYRFIAENDELRKLAKNLIGKYWQKGLRTLDSVQLASVITIKPTVDFFFTSDIILLEIAKMEGLTVKN